MKNIRFGLTILATLMMTLTGCNTENQNNKDQTDKTKPKTGEKVAPIKNTAKSPANTPANTPAKTATQPAKAPTKASAPTVTKTTVAKTQPAKVATATTSKSAESGCIYDKALKKSDKAAGTSTSSAPPAGCGHAAPAAAAAGTVAHYGKPFTQTKSVSIDSVLNKAAEFNNKAVRVSATINKVCQKKGCWFVLQGSKGDGKYVRVTMRHKFLIPIKSTGKRVVVEGTFRRVALPEAVRKHLAEDGGDDPKKVKGGGAEYTLLATSVSISG